jgi:hypothetical protein
VLSPLGRALLGTEATASSASGQVVGVIVERIDYQPERSIT